MANDVIDKLTEQDTREIVKTTKKNPVSKRDSNELIQKGDNSNILKHNFRLYKLAKVNMKDVEQVENRISEYLEICTEDDARPTVEGLALALGINRRTLWKYAFTNDIIASDEVRDTLKKAYDLLNVYMVDLMYSNKINPVNGIFLMKNNFDYKDKSEVILTPNTQNTENAEDVKNKYLLENSIIDDTEE